MIFCFLSRTVQLASASSLPGRLLCSASTNKPVLTLFTKVKVVFRIKHQYTQILDEMALCSFVHLLLGWFFTVDFTAHSSRKQVVTSNKWRFRDYSISVTLWSIF